MEKMNKKAYVTNFVFGMIGLFTLILILTVLLGVVHQETPEDEARMLNTSLETLSETQLKFTYENLSDGSSLDFETGPRGTVTVVSVMYKFIDFVIYSSFEVAKLGVIWGSTNLGKEAIHWLLILIILSLIAPIIFPLIKIFIAICVLIADIIAGIRDKRKINKLREEHYNRLKQKNGERRNNISEEDDF